MLKFKYLYTTDVEITFDDLFVMNLGNVNLAYVTKRIEWAGEKYHFTSAVAIDANTGEVLIIAKAPTDETDDDDEELIVSEEEAMNNVACIGCLCKDCVDRKEGCCDCDICEKGDMTVFACNHYKKREREED